MTAALVALFTSRTAQRSAMGARAPPRLLACLFSCLATTGLFESDRGPRSRQEMQPASEYGGRGASAIIDRLEELGKIFAERVAGAKYYLCDEIYDESFIAMCENSASIFSAVIVQLKSETDAPEGRAITAIANRWISFVEGCSGRMAEAKAESTKFMIALAIIRENPTIFSTAIEQLRSANEDSERGTIVSMVNEWADLAESWIERIEEEKSIVAKETISSIIRGTSIIFSTAIVQLSKSKDALEKSAIVTMVSEWAGFVEGWIEKMKRETGGGTRRGIYASVWYSAPIFETVIEQLKRARDNSERSAIVSMVNKWMGFVEGLNKEITSGTYKGRECRIADSIYYSSPIFRVAIEQLSCAKGYSERSAIFIMVEKWTGFVNSRWIGKTAMEIDRGTECEMAYSIEHSFPIFSTAIEQLNSADGEPAKSTIFSMVNEWAGFVERLAGQPAGEIVEGTNGMIGDLFIDTSIIFSTAIVQLSKSKDALEKSAIVSMVNRWTGFVERWIGRIASRTDGGAKCKIHASLHNSSPIFRAAIEQLNSARSDSESGAIVNVINKWTSFAERWMRQTVEVTDESKKGAIANAIRHAVPIFSTAIMRLGNAKSDPERSTIIDMLKEWMGFVERVIGRITNETERNTTYAIDSTIRDAATIFRTAIEKLPTANNDYEDRATINMVFKWMRFAESCIVEMTKVTDRGTES